MRSNPRRRRRVARVGQARARRPSRAGIGDRRGERRGAPPRALDGHQRRAHHGSNIFAADASPAKNSPPRVAPATVDAPVQDAPSSPPSAAPVVVSDPKDLSLRDLRAACRERGLNPGGGKPALEERLAVAIAAGACAPLTAPAPLAGSKRASPVADLRRRRKPQAARLANERSVVFAAPSPAPEAPLAEAYKTHKADTFLADFLNSPRKDAGDGKGCFSKRVTVSDAKLRDLGVGRDVFALGAESTDARRPDTEAAKAKAREAAGSNIFAENLEDSVAVRVAAESKAPNPRLAPRTPPRTPSSPRRRRRRRRRRRAPTSAERR